MFNYMIRLNLANQGSEQDISIIHYYHELLLFIFLFTFNYIYPF
ncbi:hypothetical protein NC653_032121 [Populus alba x Populus x berolinensis]|uniref:Uncharacterized protein n=1 Tax=Populus alba x Populus x berolinensis TaxID=444605 RepID=A0AAD6PZG2_9ROSI|nr:hypothetical protein NC653_032121 [Populus alba x Populus x berolinensis]